MVIIVIFCLFFFTILLLARLWQKIFQHQVTVGLKWLKIRVYRNLSPTSCKCVSIKVILDTLDQKKSEIDMKNSFWAFS